MVALRNRTAPRVPPEGAVYVPAAYFAVWKEAPQVGSVAGDRLMYSHVEKLLRDLAAEGVTILAGTDMGTPYQVSGFSLHEELSLLVKAGLSEMKALQAATRDPARVFNVPDLGTIQSGKVADLVLLDANPLESIENTAKIRSVVAAGRLFERTELDAMLADIEKGAGQWHGTATR
jgi:imidazolonepropionase-like amidohydrolase